MKKTSRGWYLLVAIFAAGIVFMFAMEPVPDSDGHVVENAIPSRENQPVPGVVNAAGSSIQEPELRAFIERFYTALHGDDFESVSASFAEDATIFENGIREQSLAVYLEKHLKPEMAVMKSASRQILNQEAALMGDHALIATSSILSFSVEGKQLNFHSVETLALAKKTGRWAIQHAHWSSRPVQN